MFKNKKKVVRSDGFANAEFGTRSSEWIIIRHNMYSVVHNFKEYCLKKRKQGIPALLLNIIYSFSFISKGYSSNSTSATYFTD